MEISFDDSRLFKAFEELEPKRRLQAIRGGIRKTGNRVRKKAVSNLRSTGIRTSRDLERGVRLVVYRKKAAGFRVTVGTKKGSGRKKAQGYHTNRRGLQKPVLIWWEGGTGRRFTKSKTRVFTRKKKGHYTGIIKPRLFMEQTLAQTRDSVTNEMHDMIRESVQKVIRKYGN